MKLMIKPNAALQSSGYTNCEYLLQYIGLFFWNFESSSFEINIEYIAFILMKRRSICCTRNIAQHSTVIKKENNLIVFSFKTR